MIPSLESLDWHGFLDREPLPRVPDEALAGLRRKPILITGAGGSIGSAVALRLAEVGTELILLEASEPGLYDLHCALTRFSDRGKQVCYL